MIQAKSSTIQYLRLLINTRPSFMRGSKLVVVVSHRYRRVNRNKIRQLAEEFINPPPRWPGCLFRLFILHKLVNIEVAHTSVKVHVMAKLCQSLSRFVVWVSLLTSG